MMELKEMQRLRGIIQRRNAKLYWAITLLALLVIILLSEIPAFASGEMSIIQFLRMIWFMPVGAVALFISFLRDKKALSIADSKVVDYIHKSIAKETAAAVQKEAKESLAREKDVKDRWQAAGKSVLSEYLSQQVTLYENGYVYIDSKLKNQTMLAPEKLVAITGNTTSAADTYGILTVVTDKRRYAVKAYEDVYLARSNRLKNIRKSSAQSINQVSAIEALVAVGNQLLKSNSK